MKRFSIISFICIISIISDVIAKPPQELKFEPLKFTPPQIERRILSNGATLFLLEDHELPVINLTAYIRTGSMYEPNNKLGVASLCGTLLRVGGTATRKAEEIDEELEFLGASVETGMDTETASASMAVLKKDLDKGLEIFADILMRPVFNGKKLSIEKAKIIESIRRRNDEPFQIARREFRKLTYGDHHPLSRTAEIPMIKKISRKDLFEFYRKYYHPNNMMIAVSGDFKQEEIVQKLELLFENWASAQIIFPPVPTVKYFHPLGEESDKTENKEKRLVGHAEKPLSQVSVILGHLGIKRHNPDRFALEVMNEIFGGSSFTSRLFKEVRSRQGLAYWIGSSFSEPWDYGTIAAGCQTKSGTTGQAIKSILKEFEHIREKEVLEEELKSAQDAIVNSFVFRYATSHAIVSQKMSLEYFGFPENYLETYTQKISLVTAKDVLAAAQKYLHPDKLNFMVVGKEKDFDAPLADFGKVQTIDLKIPE